MAMNGTPHPLLVHRLPQPNYIDFVRWVPPLSALDRLVAAAVFDSSSSTSALQILSLTQTQTQTHPADLTLQSSWPSPSRITALSLSLLRHKPLLAAATADGSIHLIAADPVDLGVDSVGSGAIHAGPVSGIDLVEGGSEIVSVGDDGRVNLVSLSESRLSHRRVFDGNGLVGFAAAKWASPAEFATGGLGFGVQCVDNRKPGGPVSQFRGNWARGTSSGIVHSIDIHPSRKHTVIAGGSSGTVFAWDLRWQQQPIILSGVATGEAQAHSPLESEVWEVRYDNYMHSLNIGNISSSRILPVMTCSEDGILAVVEQDEEPIELLAEPCAINSFDIDGQNPSDVICSLEWESIAILSRP
ncbi:transducin/WD40 repeat-like superfamily protein [Actinidia rufa]|uniref:Transducin/WD40 repeat-like superfamily protein n=1 Tax=Actinidia rufa TaxID=165716 RepID=A0A7J0E389_9ERIC|nr:transducin/WD40 repeat-like superfamily protein [Actinidia rufa]